MVATFVIARKIYQFEIKDSEIQKYPLCLGNISGDCSAYSMKKKKKKKKNTPGLNGYVYDFSVDYRALILLILPIFINI